MRIKPNKYTNIDISVLGLSVEIIKILNEREAEKYNNLLRKLSFRKGDRAKNNFKYALIFLYSLGKVKYDPQHDTVSIIR